MKNMHLFRRVQIYFGDGSHAGKRVMGKGRIVGKKGHLKVQVYKKV